MAPARRRSCVTLLLRLHPRALAEMIRVPAVAGKSSSIAAGREGDSRVDGGRNQGDVYSVWRFIAGTLPVDLWSAQRPVS